VRVNKLKLYSQDSEEHNHHKTEDLGHTSIHPPIYRPTSIDQLINLSIHSAIRPATQTFIPLFIHHIHLLIH